MNVEDKWREILESGSPIDNSKCGMPRPEWTDHLEECMQSSLGLRHPDIQEYIKETNSRGYAFLVESEEAWVID